MVVLHGCGELHVTCVHGMSGGLQAPWPDSSRIIHVTIPPGGRRRSGLGCRGSFPSQNHQGSESSTPSPLPGQRHAEAAK